MSKQRKDWSRGGAGDEKMIGICRARPERDNATYPTPESSSMISNAHSASVLEVFAESNATALYSVGKTESPFRICPSVGSDQFKYRLLLFSVHLKYVSVSNPKR